MKILDKGSIEDRTKVIILALARGYIMHSSSKGTWLTDTDTGHSVVIPRDVMEYMISEDLLTFIPHN